MTCIEDVFEIHRDPGGHYHHWTILVCADLTESLVVRDFLELTLDNELSLPCRIIGFELPNPSNRPTSVESVTPETTQSPFAITTQSFAFSNKDLCDLRTFRKIDFDQYRVLVDRLIQQQYPVCPCSDCTQVLRELPGWNDIFENLNWGTNPYGYSAPTPNADS